MGELGIGVVGCGGIAHAHLKAMDKDPRTRLVAVADVLADRANAVAEQYGAAETYESWEPVHANDNVDAVIVCLPHDLHAPATIAALEAGKHVLVEKPIATTLEDAAAMIAAARRAGRVLMVGHVTRFRRTATAMQQFVTDGVIGEPFSFQTVYYGPREIMPSIPWVMSKASGGGGPLMGFGTHHVDILHWLFGDVADVASFTSRAVLKEAEVEDTAAVAVRFRSGVIGTIHFTWARSVDAFHEQFRVLGSGGEIVATDVEELNLASESRFGDRAFHVIDAAEEVPDLPTNSFEAQLAHFVECVRTGATPFTDGPGARRALAVVLAAYGSAERGETVTVEY